MKFYSCTYCNKKSHEDQGFPSKTLYEEDEYLVKHYYWFCSKCCCDMIKFEMGEKNMSLKLYQELKQKLYPSKK